MIIRETRQRVDSRIRPEQICRMHWIKALRKKPPEILTVINKMIN